jgi:predicted nucleic acid-binding protein
MIPDTNIVIAYLEGEDAVVKALSQWRENVSLFLPTVVESEVLSFGKWNDVERHITEEYLANNFVSVVFDRSIAHIAAKLRRTTSVKFPDVAIAASALHLHVPLMTRNIRDFKRIPNLDLRTI